MKNNKRIYQSIIYPNNVSKKFHIIGRESKHWPIFEHVFNKPGVNEIPLIIDTYKNTALTNEKIFEVSKRTGVTEMLIMKKEMINEPQLKYSQKENTIDKIDKKANAYTKQYQLLSTGSKRGRKW